MTKEPLTILITGAASGIGAATVKLLSDHGFRVAAVARKDDDIARLARIGPGVLPFMADLSRPEEIERLSAEVKAKFGSVDVLINNAGFGVRGAVEECPPAAVREMFEVNTFAPYLLARHFLPEMRERKNGLILNISSVTGILSSPFSGMYAASKHALEGWSDSLRMEVQPFGVRVVLVQLGMIRTNFMENSMRRSEPVLSNHLSVYAPVYRKTVQAFSRLSVGALRPEKTARLLLRIIKAKRPRARYRQQFLARIAPFLLTILPRRLLDRLLQLQIGLR